MKDGLYHKDVGLPADLKIGPVFGLKPSRHAQKRAEELNVAEVPTHFLPRVAEVIEVEVADNKIIKILARQSLDKLRDVCYVFLADSRLIKTIWINMVDDKHFTLDKSRFVKP